MFKRGRAYTSGECQKREKRPPELLPAAFVKSWLPAVDNLRNLFLMPPAEMLGFFRSCVLSSGTLSETLPFGVDFGESIRCIDTRDVEG